LELKALHQDLKETTLDKQARIDKAENQELEQETIELAKEVQALLACYSRNTVACPAQLQNLKKNLRTNHFRTNWRKQKRY
jgi:hypothetical protein